jgi:hypothetical protein
MQRTICILIVLFAVVPAPAADKTPVPGKAEWDLRAFNSQFTLADTIYDADKKQLTWVLEVKDDVRTVDLVRDLSKDRPFQLVFTNDDNKELAIMGLGIAKFKGIPTGEKLTRKGTKLELTFDMPNVLDKTAKVTLSRVKGQ